MDGISLLKHTNYRYHVFLILAWILLESMDEEIRRKGEKI